MSEDGSHESKGEALAGTEPQGSDFAALGHQVALAQAGDADALEGVVEAIQADVYNLALRFLWHPQDAEDATQEILLRVITRLGSFRGESAFRTWVFRVACNALITMKKSRAEESLISFEEFADDLTRGLSDAPLVTAPDVEQELALEEVKIGCTTAMLLCLTRPYRLAYVLGEILQLDHNEASKVLEISRPNFRKRVSRARSQITDLMQRRCGLFDPSNACRCRRRVNTAVRLGRLDPDQLLFASSREQAQRFPQILDEIRGLEKLSRAAALFRSHPTGTVNIDLVAWLKDLISKGDEGLGDLAAFN